MAVTRATPVMVDDKFDYPTQIDDFKDITNNAPAVTWEQLIKTAQVFEAMDRIAQG